MHSRKASVSRKLSCDYADTSSFVSSTFQKAKMFLPADKGSRLLIRLYTERKLLIFSTIHLIVTLAVWSHFSAIKWQENQINESEDYYIWKRIGPTIIFGSKHAILLQMLLLPLTMSKFTIAALSETIVNRFVPLNRTLQMHIYLGYIMIFLTLFATLGFFIFYGTLCSLGEQEFCDKMTSEIMWTGYGITGFLLVILGTAYFRYSIPYEVFYVTHHLVFLMYFVTILHTVDRVQRDDARDRYQTFKWFTVTIFFYIFDRCNAYINHKYDVKIQSVSKHEDRNNARMIILKLQRPALFRFKPGQYATLRLKDIEPHWHPFSIASHPTSSTVDFYIEVFGEGSWTRQLWDTLQDDNELENTYQDALCFELMGPFGTSMAKTEEYSHALAIGAGTGIVPILSLLRQHVHVMTRLSPESYHENILERERKIVNVKRAADRQKGSIAQQIYRSCFAKSHVHEVGSERKINASNYSTRRSVLRNTIRENLMNMQARLESYSKKGGAADDIDFSKNGNASLRGGTNRVAKSLNKSLKYSLKGSGLADISKSITKSFIKESFNSELDNSDGELELPSQPSQSKLLEQKKNMKKESNKAMRFIYWNLYQSLLPPSGVVVTCLLLVRGTDLHEHAEIYVKALNLIFHLTFAIIAIFVWRRFRVFAFFDLVVVLATAQVDFAYALQGRTTANIACVVALNLVMVFRFWDTVVKTVDDSWSNSVDEDGLNHMERLELIWVTRSVDFVTEILPHLQEEWDTLARAWGKDNAEAVCRISVYVTDKNVEAQQFLIKELAEMGIPLGESIQFRRPDFQQIIEDYNVEILSTMKFSQSLLAFCGSPTVSRLLSSGKIANELLKGITGYKEHHMEFVSESYGGVKSTPKSKPKPKPKLSPLTVDKPITEEPTKIDDNDKTNSVSTTTVEPNETELKDKEPISSAYAA